MVDYNQAMQNQRPGVNQSGPNAGYAQGLVFSYQDQAHQQEMLQADEDDHKLTANEIEDARSRIIDLHPYALTPIMRLFPFIGCIFCSCCKCWNTKKLEERIQKLLDLKKFLRQTENENMDKILEKYGVQYTGSGPDEKKTDTYFVDVQSIRETNKDPLVGLGFGFQSYFRMLYSMAGIFMLLTLLFLPQMSVLVASRGLYGMRNYANTQFTLGNLGYSEPRCVQQSVTMDKERLFGCEVGNITKIYSYGIIPNIEHNDDWKDTNIYAYCGPSNIIPEVNYCTETYWHNFYYEDAISEYCVGQKYCNVNLRDFAPNINSTAALADGCFGQTARFYVQYYCQETNKEIDAKRDAGLAFACIGFFAITCYSLCVFYLDHTCEIDYKLWDLQTITAADFTVEMTITEKMWEQHLLQMAAVQEPMPTKSCPSMQEMQRPVAALAQSIENEVTRRIINMPMVIKRETNFNVAHISFAYDNAKILELLLKRGELITKGKIEKPLVKINKQIDELIEKEGEKLQRPVAAFITFETQEAIERALYYFPPKFSGKKYPKNYVNPVLEEDREYLGQPLHLRRATEPSNMLWENRHNTWQVLLCRSTLVVGIIALLLIGSLGLFIYMMAETVTNQLKYPPSTDCVAIDSQFNNDFTEGGDYWQQAQIDERFTMEQQGTGIYQCFCHGYVTHGKLTKVGQYGICGEYVTNEVGGYLTTTSITVLISVINIVIRTICIVLIRMIGFHTISVQASAVMVLVTLATFFNTAILLLLTQANTQETILGWIPLRGSYATLSADWYILIGDALVWTMLINAVTLYISFFTQILTAILMRSWDKGCSNFWRCKQVYQTRTKTIQEYVNLYGGPEHVMYVNYAVAMNTIFTTLLYGLALPILFPIAMLTFVNIYVIEKLTIAYWYKKPPVYDDVINRTALGMMRWAPLGFFLFGYWLMSNKQMFNNKVEGFYYKNYPQPSLNNGMPWTVNGPALPLFFALVVYLIILIFGKFWKKCMNKCCQKMHLMTDTDLEIDHEIGNYFDTIPSFVRKLWFTTEVYENNRLGLKTFGTASYEKIRTTEGKKKMMKNTPSYEILNNPLYIAAFHYVPVSQRKDTDQVNPSDLITACLYMAQIKKGSEMTDKFAELMNGKHERMNAYLKRTGEARAQEKAALKQEKKQADEEALLAQANLQQQAYYTNAIQ